jgi:glycosyltransferase involved in cell wall biosynthesis
MPDLYRAADIFALCSLRETFGIVLLEAMATGIPCLVHKYPVEAWVIGEGGRAIDMAAPGDLAAAMAGLADDAELRGRLGQAARERCAAMFEKTEVVKRNLEYYHQVLGHAPGTGAPVRRILAA